MNEPTDPSDRQDDFAAGWLLAWKAVLSTGTAVPNVGKLDLPPELGDRLRGSAECLRRLDEVWPARPALAAAEAAVGAAPDSGDSPLPQIGRFRVHRELGRGGFGVVYLAHDPILDRDVAVKVPYAATGLDPEAGHRLAVEAQAAARLGHPNIVPVHECGTSGGMTYVVSAYCPGISLADWLQRTDRPVPWEDAARVVAALACGVQHAHARGVLHRDLKPANVLLTLADTSPPSSQADLLPLTAYTPQIADFGMAKFLVESNVALTVTGVIRGTPAYMAPEQAAGHHRDITTAVDVYALGAILYELLVRRPAFHGDTPLAILDKVRNELPTPPRAIRHEIPSDLETVCLKSMDKDPARRYRSADDLAADLARVLLGEPVYARRPGRFERVRRSLRRHPAVTGLSLLLVLTLLAGLVVTGRQLQQTRRERNRAERHLAQLLDANEQTAITTINDFESRTEEMSPLRQKLLSESAERFAQLASQLGDDPSEQLLRGRCYLHLAVLYFNMGKTDESRAASLRAVESYGSHARNYPEDPKAAYGLAAALMRRALTEHDDLVRQQTAERAHEAFAKYLALQEEIRGPSHDREAQFATFHYDLAVVESSRGNHDSARHYLAASCERLRPLCVPGSPVDHQVRLLLAHFLRFRCQIERFDGQPHAAIEAGSESLDIAKVTIRERLDDPVGWLALAGAHNEYGLALEKGGKPKEAIEVWREGYERIGHAELVRSTGGLAGVTSRLRYYRLMIAHNLALRYGSQYNANELERWSRTGLELARQLLFVMPNDRQLWYIHGMCCAHLIELGRYRDLPLDRMSLQVEGLASLETALRMKPEDHKLRSDLGWIWHLYAIEHSKARQHVAASFALGRAIAHQAGAVAAMPDAQSYRDRLKSHFVRFFEVVARLDRVCGTER